MSLEQEGVGGKNEDLKAFLARCWNFTLCLSVEDTVNHQPITLRAFLDDKSAATSSESRDRSGGNCLRDRTHQEGFRVEGHASGFHTVLRGRLRTVSAGNFSRSSRRSASASTRGAATGAG